MAEQRFPFQFTREAQEGEILVVGLGRFGSALAHTLFDMGRDVLAVDSEMAIVQLYADTLPHVVQCDTTSERALRQIGAADVSTAVVCIGSDVEDSVLTTANLVDIGIANIWAKAITRAHGKILERVGAHHVVFPEADMGRRVAHLLTGRMLEYVQLDADFVLAETRIPPSVAGKTLGESRIRDTYAVTVVCTKTPGGSFTYATPDTVLGTDDLVVVAGHRAAVERYIRAV